VNNTNDAPLPNYNLDSYCCYFSVITQA